MKESKCYLKEGWTKSSRESIGMDHNLDHLTGLDSYGFYGLPRDRDNCLRSVSPPHTKAHQRIY